jgi:mono/diheme cytochrome c family protein
LDALAAYLSSLNTFENSPFRNNDGTLTAEAQAGKLVFQSANCAQCHGGAAFSGSGNATLFNIGTLKASSGQRLGSTLSGIDPPTLRDVWASAPYLHDGSAATLAAAVSAHNNISLNATQVQQVVAYLQQIGGQESAPSGNQSPSVSISSPSNNVSFTAPANINIVASASDSDGSIVKVEFFNGTTKLGEDTSAPYEFGWSNVAAGTYAITAKATDNGGATTTSTVVNVTVDSTAPPPSGTVITDTLDNISRIVAFSSPSAFTFDSGWASYFSNDTSRLMRTRAGQEWLTWQLNGMNQFVATTYFWTNEAINHFTFLASSDNVNFTTVTPSISNQGGDWIKIVYTLNLPAGTNYVRVVFPNNTTSWTPQIGEVSYSSSAAPPPPPGDGSTRIDPLDNLSQAFAFSDWTAFGLDTNWSSYFANDASRLMRTRSGQVWATWRFDNMNQFVATTFFWPNETINHFAFLASSDNVNFTTITPSISNQGGEWTKVVYTLSLPAGTNYVRVVFPNNPTTWSPQISEVRMSKPN